MIEGVFIHSWDAGTVEEGLVFARREGFGELVAAGRGRDVAVVVPTQFVIPEDETVLLHLLRPNPVWEAVAENPRVLLAVSGDWAFIPSDWKTIADEDPRTGIPTTYYSSVQLVGTAEVVADEDGVAEILRAQLGSLQPQVDVVDPSAHGRTLLAIQGMRMHVDSVRAKFKYGSNVDDAHREAVAERLEQRNGPGDTAAAARVRRSLAAEE